MAFTTKLDFSSNRQVKQHEKTITSLSGGTSFGLTFTAMTSGPDLTTSSITQTITSITSTFSGNSGTTNYSWYDGRMSLGESALSAITPSISGITQITGPIFTSDTSTIIDNNNVVLSYSGVDYSVTVTAMNDLGGGSYSGTISTATLDILSANTLDYTGRTIWNDVSGITRTERLIITNNPQIDYVWTCLDSEGMGEWQENTLGVFMAGKAPEAIPTHSLTAKGIPDGAVISGYTNIYYNNTDISGTLTTPFGTFDNTTGLFTTNTDCVLNVEAWIHLKANTSSTTAWETGATPTQIGIGICPNNTTDINVGNFLTILPSISRGLDISTGITLRALSGSSFRIKVLNQTSRAYLGSGSVSGDYMRFNITRIA